MRNKPTGNEIRKQFIDFFVEKKGHTAVRSASLVPAGDQTLLFTNAGMVQFKEVFLGTDSRPYTRAVDSQKCMRVAGKHNDLDDVGRDDTHHTFFEMLGNWSFGDYYKKEAISWAWELLTEVWGLDKSKLWATVFKDDKGELPADEEAFTYWTQQPGIDPSHVLYFGRKENFWEMADTGPCGPCSEIHIDLGPEHCDKKDVPGHICSVNGDCSRFLELWNLVFIQYNRINAKTFVPLKQKHVDTGMGLERIVSVLQQTDSNYRTDLFSPMIKTIQSLTKASDEEMNANFTPYRVVADHARAAAFLIADGVTPGNIGRNYVCRMIIRRAVRFGQQIGLHEPFMSKVAAAVVENYGEAYPELKKSAQSIKNSIEWEEDRFNKTLDNGISHLNDIIGEMEKNGKKVIDGETCFDLYATHGLPLEITHDIIRDYGFDVDRKGFMDAAEAHRIASGGGKAIGKMGGEDAEIYETFKKELIASGKIDEAGVRDDPYSMEPLETQLIMIIRDGESVSGIAEGDIAELITPETNFYLEMGGQVGDHGRITGENFEFEVTEISRVCAGLIVHKGVLKSGKAALGDSVTVCVDSCYRNDIMRNHTATHLLHAALHQVIGEEARQAGSLVAADRLRFDFNCNRPMTTEEISEVERIVNENILKALPVSTRIEKLDDAMKEGVTALFSEKYGQEVRVVRIGENGTCSAELCGGTHIRNTSEIGLFVILSEGSVATGIRRIEAISGRVANERVRTNMAAMRNLAFLLNVQPDEVNDRVLQMQSLATKTQKEVSELRERLAFEAFEKISQNATRFKDVDVLTAFIPDVNAETLRAMADKFKEKHPNAVCVFSTVDHDQVTFISTVAEKLVKRGINAGELIRAVAAQAEGKGGGKPTMAQAGAKRPDKIQVALNETIEFVKEKLKD